MIIYTNEGKVPVPDGWTLERALGVLTEAGHVVLRVEENGKITPLPEQAA